ncbi:MAG: elongation factor 4 [Clostridiales bacterium]|nr:elongation factor 4 [Clostridiales bacterium]
MPSSRQEQIRNFCIIAHIDHGKSTLADRLLEETGVMGHRDLEEQVLDSMDLERERGITIKAKAAQLVYKRDGKSYTLNLIDTPGHGDFSYEVSRSLAACEGAILVVDAVQGIEAQTLANVYLALEHDLEIIPVINKIDLPSARPDWVKKEIEDVIGLETDDIPLVSAKDGIGISEVLDKIVDNIPPPQGDESADSKALIFDSFYDAYRGVICHIRVMEGKLKPGDEILMMATGKKFEVTDVGVFMPDLHPVEELKAGDVGFLAASIKNVRDARVGDTITLAKSPAKEALPGYRQAVPMVFCGIYPADGSDYGALDDALEKLQINDASLVFEAETSAALGFGFRCGFLGLLHMEIVQERLEREYDLDIVTTAPSVIYKMSKSDGSTIDISNPVDMPDATDIVELKEPVVDAQIITPSDYVGAVMELCQERRGVYRHMEYIDEKRVTISYDLPLNEIVYDFFDALKSRTRGFASFDYDIKGYQVSDLVRLDILLNGEMVDALSLIVHSDKAYTRGRSIAKKLREVIPRQHFEIPIQAAIGSRIIARETVKALRKDVLAKCYGGDISRKRKLLERQKEGKKRMRQVGSVEVPQEAFMAVLKID